MLLVKTWCENTQEGINYLKFNNYGNKVKRILNTDYFICTGGIKPRLVADVKIV